MTPKCADMHIHLDQFDDPAAVAHDAAKDGCALFCATTTPKGYLSARKELSAYSNVRVGVGLHPWWIADGRCGKDDIRELEKLIPTERFVGEIGLDFLEKHASKSSWEAQMTAFARICATCGAIGGKVLTIHSVRATATTLAILAETGCLERCSCIFHWFSDSTEQLWQAIKAGCWFSLGERSLRTGKGREYVKLIPPDRLLFETDMPWPLDAARGYAAVKESLASAQERAAAIIGSERATMACENSANLLGL